MQVTTRGNTLILDGRLDGRSTALVREHLHALMRGGCDVVVDLSRVESVDATGLGVLAAAGKQLSDDGRRLVLRGTPAGLRRVLAFTRVRSLLMVEREGSSRLAL
jgi:anti-anti-sigma factor